MSEGEKEDVNVLNETTQKSSDNVETTTKPLTKHQKRKQNQKRKLQQLKINGELIPKKKNIKTVEYVYDISSTTTQTSETTTTTTKQGYFLFIYFYFISFYFLNNSIIY